MSIQDKLASMTPEQRQAFMAENLAARKIQAGQQRDMDTMAAAGLFPKFMSAMTGGLGERAYGAMGGDFKEARDAMQETEQRHPEASFAADVAGALAPASVFSKGVQGLSRIPQIARTADMMRKSGKLGSLATKMIPGAMVGSGLGGTFSHGRGQDVLPGMGYGALTGAVLGPVLKPMMTRSPSQFAGRLADRAAKKGFSGQIKSYLGGVNG